MYRERKEPKQRVRRQQPANHVTKVRQQKVGIRMPKEERAKHLPKKTLPKKLPKKKLPKKKLPKKMPPLN